MMIGETHRYQHHIPSWHHDQPLNPTAHISSPQSNGGSSSAPLSPTHYDAVLASLRRYLLSSEQDSPEVADFSAGDYDDEFFMYDFKVRKCARIRAHDWTECPFAHPGEKARRRDPRKFNYSGTACAEFRKGGCKKGDHCEFAHGVFECWLHPTRFRTQACKDGPGCKRRVCFFAHSPDQLRAGSDRSGQMEELLVANLRNLQLSKVKSMPVARETPWGNVTAVGRAGYYSLPTTPTRPRIGYWDAVGEEEEEEEVVMERVESGKELRARMFEKLSKENPLDGPSLGPGPGHGFGPDLGWVSDLIE